MEVFVDKLSTSATISSVNPIENLMSLSRLTDNIVADVDNLYAYPEVNVKNYHFCCIVIGNFVVGVDKNVK